MTESIFSWATCAAREPLTCRNTIFVIREQLLCLNMLFVLRKSVLKNKSLELILALTSEIWDWLLFSKLSACLTNISKYLSNDISPRRISTKRESFTTSTPIWIRRDPSSVFVRSSTPKFLMPNLRQKTSEQDLTCGRKIGLKKKECRATFITIICGKPYRYPTQPFLESFYHKNSGRKKDGQKPSRTVLQENFAR